MPRISNLSVPSPARPEPRTPAASAADYLDLYGLSKPPFGGQAGYMLFDSHRPAFQRLVDHMINGTGLAVLHGDDGAGKTAMLAAAAAVAGESGIRIIRPLPRPHGRITRADLVAAIVDEPPADEASLIQSLLGPPRAVLLLDDAGRLAADCDSLLVHLLGHQADGVVMVISVNPFLPAGSLQSSIASFIRVNLHIPRLNAAESQQYIERALWVSGGTIRRLITPGALRMIVSVSKGMPGSINRVMESVFIAGFARGDARISARTVASVIGPGIAGGPRRDEARRPPSAVPPLIGVALLLIGLGAFLYRGLTGPAFHAQPTAQAPGPDDMAAVRASLLQAATAGDAAAALALATSYDPDFQTIGADPARAADWYRKAIALGDPQAGTLLAQMQAATGKPTAP